MSKFWQWIGHGATYVGVAVCRGIIFVFDGVAAVGKFVKEAVHVVGEIAVGMFQRVCATKVVQKVSECIKTVWDGVKALKKAIDVPETLHTIWLILLWFWAVAMGQACSSPVALPWATAFCATGVMYFSLLIATTLFALFLIGTLFRPFRN